MQSNARQRLRRRTAHCAFAAGAVLAVFCGSARAEPVTREAMTSCLPHIAQAERHYGLPQGLLMAIALTESGHGGAPYPWALNLGGAPRFPGAYPDAARLLRDGEGRPRRDVAVGCMQIHMAYHLEAFGAPEWALHPFYNVWYGAQFLRQLAVRYGSWVAAIAHYHGSDPQAQRTYLCQVAHYLRRTGPRTLAALGLGACATVPVAATGSDGEARRREAIQAARRVGRIIVLGRDRLGG
jgi:hypothetical protein